jgi:hypothetical protein
VSSFLQEQINITLDHRCRIFQNLDGALGEQPPREGWEAGRGREEVEPEMGRRKEMMFWAGSKPKRRTGQAPPLSLCLKVASLLLCYPETTWTSWGRAVGLSWGWVQGKPFSLGGSG